MARTSVGCTRGRTNRRASNLGRRASEKRKSQERAGNWERKMENPPEGRRRELPKTWSRWWQEKAQRPGNGATTLNRIEHTDELNLTGITSQRHGARISARGTSGLAVGWSSGEGVLVFGNGISEDICLTNESEPTQTLLEDRQVSSQRTLRTNSSGVGDGLSQQSGFDTMLGRILPTTPNTTGDEDGLSYVSSQNMQDIPQGLVEDPGFLGSSDRWNSESQRSQEWVAPEIFTESTDRDERSQQVPPVAYKTLSQILNDIEQRGATS
ncbi:hypothetical protein K435DRAFT_809129 [Dendrothele bispora CBS 962.96]|uniref:Uncharacterized protein n=1 Tax=Dendrothele bispora (strain CBS 962.96) TaxID=1314807 RepID=A0A4S8KZK9_DENBC|nr:hypothetical protein K435DRAFT_809129 [Dendrothele bispora CBS 962.96]